MAEPDLTATRLAGGPESPRLLVVGPSLGTSVEALWEATARRLVYDFEVVGWDLPGHGRSKPATGPFTVGELAAAVRRLAADVAGDRPAAYAGVSLGGAVALELALDPGVFTAVACIASAAKIGEPSAWHERAALVRKAGTSVMVSGSSERWFAPGFLMRDPATGTRLLLSLADADKDSYALACEALADFDVRDRLADATVPLLVAPGDQDVVISPHTARKITADRAPNSSMNVFTGCGHLPPAEDPDAVARALNDFATGGKR
ncbi:MULTISPECIES: alpha/beta hydrolase [Janibacter]|uniref:alpha/beta fold hydrolase n=1 Tax=Janibacter TaxID=53457 RepID=UPI00083432E2|nr:alpha/beta hydrolase [Janibacter terrae]